MYLPDDIDEYDRDDNGNHDCPVDVIVHDCPLLQQIAINTKGCGGSRYSLLIALLVDTFSPPRNVDVGSIGGGNEGGSKRQQ